MIYSQTPLRNRLVRVSIKADGDGALLTFLDTQWSAVLSVPSSYLQSLHLFFSYLSCSLSYPPLEMHTCKCSPLLLLLYVYSSKIPNWYFVSLSNFRSVTAEQTCNTITQETEHCWSSRLVSSVSAWVLAPTSCVWLLLLLSQHRPVFLIFFPCRLNLQCSVWEGSGLEYTSEGGGGGRRRHSNRKHLWMGEMKVDGCTTDKLQKWLKP